MDLISIIVPVYNVEEYLDCCVESIVDQTYKNLEIILVDDGSTDNSGQICDHWAEKDQRVKVIHQPNMGGAAARNAALNVVKGDFIAFVDSDDYIADDMYEKLLATIKTSGSDIAECSYVFAYGDGEKAVYSNQNYVIYSGSKAMYSNLYNIACQRIIWNKLYKKKAIGNIRFVEDKTIDDEFFTYRVVDASNQVAVIVDKLYFYRQHASSVMHRKYSIKKLDGFEACVQRCEYLIGKYPELSSDARINLRCTAMFHYQMILLYLTGEDRADAIKHFEKISNGHRLYLTDIFKATGTMKFWLLLSKLNFKFTCIVRNILCIGK